MFKPFYWLFDSALRTDLRIVRRAFFIREISQEGRFFFGVRVSSRESVNRPCRVVRFK